jgi:hypothetical protein
MLVIDENVSELEVSRLRKWGIRVRLIGEDVAEGGTTDENLLAALLRLTRPVLGSQDADFFRFGHSHAKYGLVWLDIKPNEVAAYIRRFLKKPEFDTQGKRLGVVARIHPRGGQFWRHGHRVLHAIPWQD